MPKKPAGKDLPVDVKPKGKPVISPEQASARRDFLKVSVAAGVGACAVGAPVCGAVRLVTAPAFIEEDGGKFYSLATLESLDVQPLQKLPVIDDKQDAWTTIPRQKIGSVFLRKVGGTVQAFNALCPHAGCMIQVGVQTNPKTKVEEEMFYCPCHAAHFDLEGKRLDVVAPRDMDALEVEIKEGQVFVKFEKFTFGIAEKKAN
jgi:cytochrome b6-f complex iron-sulfur subunit/menaquinol-cytochrome c reductase iron-sulfur subunit